MGLLSLYNPTSQFLITKTLHISILFLWWTLTNEGSSTTPLLCTLTLDPSNIGQDKEEKAYPGQSETGQRYSCRTSSLFIAVALGLSFSPQVFKSLALSSVPSITTGIPHWSPFSRLYSLDKELWKMDISVKKNDPAPISGTLCQPDHTHCYKMTLYEKGQDIRNCMCKLLVKRSRTLWSPSAPMSSARLLSVRKTLAKE